jgi:hypothetical protein
MTYADYTAPRFAEQGWGYIGKVSRAWDVSPNLYWLDLVVMDCGPRGEAVPVARTQHHVVDHVRPMKPGFKTTEIGLRAGQLRAAAYV